MFTSCQIDMSRWKTSWAKPRILLCSQYNKWQQSWNPWFGSTGFPSGLVKSKWQLVNILPILPCTKPAPRVHAQINSYGPDVRSQCNIVSVPDTSMVTAKNALGSILPSPIIDKKSLLNNVTNHYKITNSTYLKGHPTLGMLLAFKGLAACIQRLTANG